MPVKQRFPKRRIEELPPAYRAYLLAELNEHELLDALKDSKDYIKAMQLFWRAQCGNHVTEEMLWHQHGEEILQEFVSERPGSRPSCWWKFSARRCSDEQLREWRIGPDSIFWNNGRPAEPRLHLSGIGVPVWLDPQSGVTMPKFWSGCPILWSGDSEPDTVESEAAYLKRHGLFLPGEEERLTPNDFAPETLIDYGGNHD